MFSVSSGYDDLLGVLVAESLDSGEILDVGEEDLVEDDGVVFGAVEGGVSRLLGEPDAEELVEGHTPFFVVARELVGRAHEEHLVSPPLHVLAGEALAAARELGPNHDPSLLLEDLAEAVGIPLLFERKYDLGEGGLLDGWDQGGVLLEGQAVAAPGEADVLLLGESPVSNLLGLVGLLEAQELVI